jgi:hypothetical protein
MRRRRPRHRSVVHAALAGVGLAGWQGWVGAPAATAAAAAPDGGWRWPLSGHPIVVRRFEPPPSRYAPGHRGVDLEAAADTPVLAAGPGVIAYGGLVAGRGVVTIAHAGGLTTEYEPVAAAVRSGMRVAGGQRIGRVEGTHAGCARPCLHWGLRRGATYLDPLGLLGLGPVRLLPLLGGSATSAGASVAGRRVAGLPARQMAGSGTGRSSGSPPWRSSGAGPRRPGANAGRRPGGRLGTAALPALAGGMLGAVIGVVGRRRSGRRDDPRRGPPVPPVRAGPRPFGT